MCLDTMKDKKDSGLRGGLVELCSGGGLLGVCPKSHIDLEWEEAQKQKHDVMTTLIPLVGKPYGPFPPHYKK